MASQKKAQAKYLIGVFLHVLNGLQDSERLLYVPAECQVVDSCMLDDALHTHIQTANHSEYMKCSKILHLCARTTRRLAMLRLFFVKLLLHA